MLNSFRKPTNRKLEKPIVIQFPVIDICNSRCQMCNIWQQKDRTAVSPDEIRKGFSNKIFSRVESVGINGGEPTLRADLAQVVEALFDSLPRLKTISLITNAYNVPIVKKRIGELAEAVKRKGGILDVMVSLDGYGEVHDKVRGKPGNFVNATEVLDYVLANPLVATVRVGCTIIKENVYGLHDLFDFCQKKKVYIKYRMGIPHQRLYSDKTTEPFALNHKDIFHIVEFINGLCKSYEKSILQKFFYKSLINQLLYGAPRAAGCDWQHRGVTVTARGELSYCAVKSPIIGKIGVGDNYKDYFNSQDKLRKICESDCATCLHDYVGKPDLRTTLKLFLIRVSNATKKRFGFSLESLFSKLKSILSGVILYRRQIFYQKLIKLSRKNPISTEPKSLIIGWYGTETAGDKAILGGIVEEVYAKYGSDHKIVLASYNPYITKITLEQLRYKNILIVTVEEAARSIPSYKQVIFGGGPLMAIGEMIEMSLIFEEAKRRQITTIVAGCGVGPFGNNFLNDKIKKLLKNSKIRIYRDQKSLDAARGLGINTNSDKVSIDPAFNFMNSFDRKDTLHGLPQDKKVILLGWRDFPYIQYAYDLGKKRGQEIAGQSKKNLLELAKILIAQNYYLLPIPMCTNHFGDDDRFFYRELFNNLTDDEIKSVDYRFLSEEKDMDDYVKAYNSCDAAITMRFHSLVFALASHKPVVVLDYTLGAGKVDSLSKRFAVESVSLADINAEKIVHSLEKLLHKPHPDYKSQIQFQLKADL